jgi:hypothetical protein
LRAIRNSEVPAMMSSIASASHRCSPAFYAGLDACWRT